MTFKFGRPIGDITVYQNGKMIKAQSNLFTKYGLNQAYMSGKNFIIRNSDGGIFKYFHVGDSTNEITPDSTGLGNHISTATRIQSNLAYRTYNTVRYAVFTTEWQLPAGISGFSEFGMFDTISHDTGMLCGKSVPSPIILDPDYATTIQYMVQIPIVSQITVIDSGNILINSLNYPFTLEGRFHNEEPNQLSTIFPVQTPMIVSGNLSRLYVNSTLWPNTQSKYQCDVVVDDNSVTYNIKTGIVNYSPSIAVTNVSMGNSDPSSTSESNFPIRLVFGSTPTKPIDMDMEFYVSLNIEVEN